MSDRYNVIVLMCDTFRRDHAGFYGPSPARTPHLDRLAAESVIFEDAYACSFPTLPCRVELFTGKFVFPAVRWGPFPAGETTLAERLRDARLHTALVADNLPVMRPNSGYDRGFETRIHIRGQWYDPWAEEPAAPLLPAPEELLGEPERVRQYLRNVHDRRGEEDYFAPRVMRSAADWLERFGRRGPFFLYIDCFDPHEPWDPPAEYVDPAVAAGARVIYPHLGRADRYSDAELAAIRELYAGEVRMVDRWIGHLWSAIDALGLRENTALLFLSDHGIFLGEHGMIGKAGKGLKDVDGWPPYHEVGQVPMLLRAPGLAPGRVGGFVHPGDVMPTVMELAGLPVPPGVTAASLLPLARGEVARLREVAVTSWSYRGWRPHHPTCIRNGEWSMIWWRSGIRPRLHHLPTDPEETRDVFAEHRDVARQLHGELIAFLKRQVCPPRNYWPRRVFVG